MKTPVVEVRDKDLKRLGAIPPQFLTLSATSRRNGVGDWSLSLPAEHELAAALATPGSGIVVSLDGEVFSGPTVSSGFDESTGDLRGTVTFTGVTDEIALSDRLALPDPLNADINAAKVDADLYTGPVESALHYYVQRNLGTKALAARKLAKFASSQDRGRGNTVTKSATFETLGTILSEIAGDEFNFRLRQNGSTLLFETFPVEDRSAEVRFNIQNGTVSSHSTTISAPNATSAYVGGNGEGRYRWMLAKDSTVGSEWGRRIETFVDSSDSEDDEVLGQAADEVLTANESLITSQLVPMEDTMWVFGQDWKLGERVTIDAGMGERQEIVSAWKLLADTGGVRLGAILGDEEGSVTTQAILSLDDRVANLERTSSSALSGHTLRLGSTTDAHLASTNHALQIGPTAGTNLVMDNNEIMVRNNGVAAKLFLTNPAISDETLFNSASSATSLTPKSYVDGLAFYDNAPVISGDMSTVDAWRKLSTGVYWVNNGVTAGAPASQTYGFVQIMNHNNDGTAIWHSQASGFAFKFAWNASTTAIVWREMFSSMETLTGSPDLNNYGKTGVRWVHTNAVAAAGSNFPANYAGMLETFENPNSPGTFVYQRYTTYSTVNGQVYIRGRYNGNWSAWVRVGGHLAGSVTLNPAAGATASVAVSFPSGFFTAAPSVAVTPLSASPNVCSVSANGVSETSATIYLYRSAAASTSVHYIAMARQ